jgi:four helix bundle protein
MRLSGAVARIWNVRDFRKLRVWQKAHRLALDIHLLFEPVPARRYAGLRSQVLRATASIPANIAEGCGKATHAELARFAEIALGSTTELDNHLLFARDAGVISTERHAELEPRVAELRRMLFAFIRAVRSRTASR